MIVGHATFCIVVVYNNVVARLRRTSGSFEEASADLGANTWQTFRFVTFPSMKTALAAGALLAFALSFDEIIVTTFTIGAGEETLPIWIFRNLFRPNAAADRRRRRRDRDPDLDHPRLPRPPRSAARGGRAGQGWGPPTSEAAVPPGPGGGGSRRQASHPTRSPVAH